MNRKGWQFLSSSVYFPCIPSLLDNNSTGRYQQNARFVLTRGISITRCIRNIEPNMAVQVFLRYQLNCKKLNATGLPLLTNEETVNFTDIENPKQE